MTLLRNSRDVNTDLEMCGQRNWVKYEIPLVQQRWIRKESAEKSTPSTMVEQPEKTTPPNTDSTKQTHCPIPSPSSSKDRRQSKGARATERTEGSKKTQGKQVQVPRTKQKAPRVEETSLKGGISEELRNKVRAEPQDTTEIIAWTTMEKSLGYLMKPNYRIAQIQPLYNKKKRRPP